MKQLVLKSTVFCTVIALAMTAGCNFIADITDEIRPAVTEKQAIDTLAEFSIVNELATLRILEIFSDGFTRPLFDEMVTISYADYDAVFNTMAELARYEEEVMEALAAILPEELAGRYKIICAGFTTGHDGAMPPLYSPGIMDSFRDFFGFLQGSGTRSREQILAIARGSTDSQKQQMYAELDAASKSGAADYREWFEKLENGDYDNRAHKIHGDFTANPDLPFYTEKAQDNRTLPVDKTYKEGAEMVEKGAHFYADAATTVIGKSLPGFDKGVEKVIELNDKAEKFEEYVDTYYDEGPGGVIGKAVKEKFEEFVDKAAASAFGESCGGAIVTLVNNIVQQPSPDSGTVTVQEPQAGGGTGKLIAFNRDENAPVQMFARIGESGSSPSLVLPEGSYFIVAAGAAGDDASKNQNVSVPGGGQITAILQPPATAPVKTTAASTAATAAPPATSSTPAAGGGYPQDGKWVLTTLPYTESFTTDDGLVFYNSPIEIEFEISGGKIKRMNSTVYTYLVYDFKARRGEVNLYDSGLLEIIVDKDSFAGYLNGPSGSGNFVQVYEIGGKDYENSGTWTARRTSD